MVSLLCLRLLSRPSMILSEDRTVDVRKLDREAALQRIEEAWKTVEDRNHRRLNVLVKHDDDVQSRSDSNFHLMEDLEK